jgi:methylated-DNA-protein-cysteine methyltransferase related protein
MEPTVPKSQAFLPSWAMERADRLQELWRLVGQIPHGRCVGYGDLGRALTNPVSGFLVGKWMAQAPPDVPWWRVVKKDGSIALDARDPAAGHEQRVRLRAENVPFIDDKVDMEAAGWQL